MIRFLAVLAIASSLWGQDVYRFRVELKKFPRSEKGEVLINATGVSYKSEDGKRSIAIPPLDMYEADVSNPREIRIQTYENVKRRLLGRQTHTFRLRDAEYGPELARFLALHLKRPVIGFKDSPAHGDIYEIRAYHRHRFGGCHGTVRLDAEGIQFIGNDENADSRTWMYSEIETVGTMNAFHLRVSTLNETFNFDLKARLPQVAYERAFKAVAGIASTELRK